MLVLSRKLNEAIHFPDLGITVEVLDCTSSKVRVGVEAPFEIKILRDEVVDDETRRATEERVFRVPQELRHELRNELNLLSLSLHVLRRKIERGEIETEDLSFDDLVRRVERIASHNTIASPQKGRGVFQTTEQSPTALIIEDSDNERELLGGLLEMHGFAVISVGTGELALQYLASNDNVDAIILDMGLPKIQGSELLRQIREMPRYQDTFVAVVSGSKPADNGFESENGIMNVWFEKPLNPSELLTTLSSAACL